MFVEPKLRIVFLAFKEKTSRNHLCIVLDDALVRVIERLIRLL